MNRTAGVDVKLPFAMTGPKTTAGNGMFQMTKVVASGGDLWPADDRHGDGVEIFAVDEKRVPKESLTHEANLVVERDRAGVVGAHLEFDSGKPLPEGGVQRRVEQPKADSAPSSVLPASSTTRPRR